MVFLCIHPQVLLPPAMQILFLLWNYIFFVLVFPFSLMKRKTMTTTTAKLMTTDTQGFKAGRRMTEGIEKKRNKIHRTFTHKLIYDDIKHFIQSIDLFCIWTLFHSFTTNNFPFVAYSFGCATLWAIDVFRLHLHASGAVRLVYHSGFYFSYYSYSVWELRCSMFVMHSI